MDGIELDESSSAAVHLWMSMMRLLLQVHPRVNAADYVRAIGHTAPNDPKPGWNCVHPPIGSNKRLSYIWIAPDGSDGRTTQERPGVADEEINHIYDDQLPVFKDTAAYRTLCQLSDVLTKQPSATSIRERHWSTLRTVANAPLGGPDPAVDHRIQQILDVIRSVIASDKATVDDLAAPLHRVVDDYLHLRLSRQYASNILSVVIAVLALKLPSPIPGSGVAAVKGEIDHLIGLVSKIRDERHRYDLGTFYSLTCLGMLLVETAQILAQNVAAHAPPELARLLQARSRYVEELSAHDLNPSLLHPFTLVPFGAAAWLYSTKCGISDLAGLYEGAGVKGPGALRPDDIWPQLQEYSAAARRSPVPWDAYTPILSPELTEHLQMFLVTMAVGRAMPG